MSRKVYNTTQLEPLMAIERGIMHRDMNAHIFRWTHVLKNAKIGETIVDFGSGKCNLLEVMYRNRYKPKKYIALEYTQKDLDFAKNKFKGLKFPVEFYQQDIINPTMDYSKFQADKVVSFEVAEHVGSQNVIENRKFLINFMACGNKNATYYLSTPNYDPEVGAAGNHTYDSGDGKGKRPQELDHFELQEAILETGFEIVNKFGTFASQKDYKESLDGWRLEMFNELNKYYDSNLLSNLMAPVIEPELARNTLWVLKRK